MKHHDTQTLTEAQLNPHQLAQNYPQLFFVFFSWYNAIMHTTRHGNWPHPSQIQMVDIRKM